MSKDKTSKFDVQLYKVHQTHKTIRTVSIVVGITIGIWLVTNAVVAIASIEQPAWLTLVLSLAAALGAAPTVRWARKFRRYMKLHGGRIVELETELDSSRTSSELNKDGTAPDDV